MVDMGVGEQHEVDPAHIEAEIQGTLIFPACFRAALEHAAIDQKADIAGFDQRAGAGHFAGGTEKYKTHV